MKRLIIGAVLVGLLLIGGVYWARARLDPPIHSVAATALQSLREQNRLSAFAARFVTVVTSKKSTAIGLTAQKTLIIPAMVRYEVDLQKLQQADVVWAEADRMLQVRLPAIEVSDVNFALGDTREYASGIVLMTLTDVEAALDTANRNAALKDIRNQAMAPVMINLAKDATARAVERSFAMPLRAAGVDAKVTVEFAR